jgi:hypothetical protein
MSRFGSQPVVTHLQFFFSFFLLPFFCLDEMNSGAPADVVFVIYGSAVL